MSLAGGGDLTKAARKNQAFASTTMQEAHTRGPDSKLADHAVVGIGTVVAAPLALAGLSSTSPIAVGAGVASGLTALEGARQMISGDVDGVKFAKVGATNLASGLIGGASAQAARGFVSSGAQFAKAGQTALATTLTALTAPFAAGGIAAASAPSGARGSAFGESYASSVAESYTSGAAEIVMDNSRK